MSRYISDSMRAEVASRANFQCEYCLTLERHSYLAFHIEHIISIKHKGDSSIENLAYSCQICNLRKGSDIATFIDGNIDQPVRFFHPRRDQWK